MLRHHQFGDIHYWQVARSYFGYSLYVTGFFLVEKTLIDCGPTNARSILGPLFRDLPCERVLLTHHHEDHTGNLSVLKDLKGVRALGHRHTASALSKVTQEIPFYRRVVWGRPEKSEVETIEPEIVAGSHRLTVIETPGHSPDHVCLFDPDRRWLFTGDLYLASYLRYLRDDENIFLIMESLRRLIDLQPVVLFCSHRGIVDKATDALSRKLGFLEKIQVEVEEGLRQGETEQHLANRLLRGDRIMKYFSAGEFSTLNLVRAFSRRPYR